MEAKSALTTKNDSHDVNACIYKNRENRTTPGERREPSAQEQRLVENGERRTKFSIASQRDMAAGGYNKYKQSSQLAGIWRGFRTAISITRMKTTCLEKCRANSERWSTPAMFASNTRA